MENKTPAPAPASAQGRTLHNADQKRILKRGDLMGIAVGQIIGAGVMVMSITALKMTGRSVSLAFMIAALFTLIAAIPIVFYTSVIRIKGGLYSQASIFIGKLFSGFYTYTTVFSSLSLAIFAIGMTSYLSYVVPQVKQYEVIMNMFFLTLFFALNWFGTAWMSKAQSFMFYLLVAALLLFVLFGLPKVGWGSYFTNLFDKPFVEFGFTPLMQAAAYLTFATGGATVIIAFSGESVNPKKDTPFVIILSTIGVAALYAMLAVVIGGVLPPDVVIKAGNLAPIAQQIMPTPAYWFFIIAGAGFALGTTLNSSIASRFRPFMQATDDGWYPEMLARVNKHGAPYMILGIMYVVNAAAILFNLSVQQLGSWVLLIGNLINIIMTLGIMRLPKLFPEGWAKSPYHVPNGVLNAFLIFAASVQGYQAYLNSRSVGMNLVLINLGVFVVALGLAYFMDKSGKVNMNVSYELE